MTIYLTVSMNQSICQFRTKVTTAKHETDIIGFVTSFFLEARAWDELARQDKQQVITT